MPHFGRQFASVMMAASMVGCSTLPAEQPRNFAEYRSNLVAYHNSGAYMRELSGVVLEAQGYLLSRLGSVQRPALVLDIDETSLSNWKQLSFNQFAYFSSQDQPCSFDKGTACGGPAWELRAEGEPIAPTRDLFDLAKAKGVAVYFITGRRESVNARSAVEKNLRAAGYDGWTQVVLRPSDDHGAVGDYKAGARAAIESQGNTIVVNVGDQHSDLVGGHAERGFLLPNPFYLIP